MTWNKQHDGADLDTDVHRLRRDPMDAAPKMVQVPEDYLIALEARAIRQSAMLHASRDRTDGHVDMAVLPLIAAAAQVYPQHAMRAVDRLVDVKLFKRRPKNAGGGFEIRNFLKYNPSKQQVERKEETQAKHDWLHKSANGKKVKARIIRRDRDICRACKTVCRIDGDRRGLDRRTFDFIDPDFTFDMTRYASADDMDAVVDAIVILCGYCNGVKNRRTFDQANMELQPPPGQTDLPRSTRDSIAGDPRPNAGPGNGTGRIGSDRVAGLQSALSSVPRLDPVPPPDDHDYPYEGEAS